MERRLGRLGTHTIILWPYRQASRPLPSCQTHSSRFMRFPRTLRTGTTEECQVVHLTKSGVYTQNPFRVPKVSHSSPSGPFSSSDSVVMVVVSRLRGGLLERTSQD